MLYSGEHPLSARPAARLARIATGFDAQVTLNGVQAGSVLALMGLKINPGDEVTIAATGPQSRNALDAVEAELTGQTASSAKESSQTVLPGMPQSLPVSPDR